MEQPSLPPAPGPGIVVLLGLPLRRQRNGCGAAARAGVVSDVNGTRDAVLESQFVRSNQNHHLGVLCGGVSLPEEIACRAWKICESWQAGESAGLFIVEQAADDGGLVFSNADGLGKRAVGDDGYAVDVCSGECANLELQL